MALKDLTDRSAVISAIEECDRLGIAQFRSKYGFGSATKYSLIYKGRDYDVKAILGVAHGYQFPDLGPLKSWEFTSGTDTTLPKLRSLGFEVREKGSASREGEVEVAEVYLPSTGSLINRVEQWKLETKYPTDKDKQRIAERGELAAALAEQNLDAVISDPGKFELLQIPRLAVK